MGGSLAFGQSTSFTFDTTVNAGIPAGTNITNSASVSYSGQTLGATFSTTSAAASLTVLAPPLTTTAAELDEMLDILDEAVAEVLTPLTAAPQAMHP